MKYLFTLIFISLAFTFTLPQTATAQIFKVDIPQNERCLGQDNSPFALDKIWDPVIFGAGLATYGGALVKQHFSSDDDFDSSNCWYIAPTANKNHPAVFPKELCKKILKYYWIKKENIK